MRFRLFTPVLVNGGSRRREWGNQAVEGGEFSAKQKAVPSRVLKRRYVVAHIKLSWGRCMWYNATELDSTVLWTGAAEKRSQSGSTSFQQILPLSFA